LLCFEISCVVKNTSVQRPLSAETISYLSRIYFMACRRLCMVNGCDDVPPRRGVIQASPSVRHQHVIFQLRLSILVDQFPRADVTTFGGCGAYPRFSATRWPAKGGASRKNLRLHSQVASAAPRSFFRSRKKCRRTRSVGEICRVHSCNGAMAAILLLAYQDG
jgi:hypothetical protein